MTSAINYTNDLSQILGGNSGTSLGTFNSSQTITDVNVPIPAAAWLFGSGLIGLIGIARRTRPVA